MRPGVFFFILFFASFSTATTDDPDCSGVERWPTVSAFVHLKNAGITTNDSIDFKKTMTIRIASEKKGDSLFKQVHHVTYVKKSGEKIEAITINDASLDECSMGEVQVHLISRTLPGAKPKRELPTK
jgi:hypothetical protein